ncbi:hypothetical protein EV702DRAFT_449585 [Suillus placidus]|uniref:Uncharacterized protein n=1 Tax=Suillus placidus TaxID=48579 RepID=A0A9P7D103_9AGAM|nr:hypothetical protein EV702DRAFT_449585 [Suillus placidus]
MFHQRDGRHEGREERLHDRREEFEEGLHGRREALEERRFGHGRQREHSEERGHGRQREHSEERRHGRHEERSEERRHGRHEEHSGERRHERFEEHRRDPVQPQYSPPSEGFNRADFVSDEDFKRMMHGGGEFAKPLTGGDHIRPEDFGEWDRQRPPQNAGYQASYLQQSEPSGQRFSEAPLPPIPLAQRTSGYESGAYSQPSHNQYSVPESLDPRYGSNVYAPPAGAPGAPSSYAPAGGYAPPPPARYGHEASSQVGSTRGAASFSTRRAGETTKESRKLCNQQRGLQCA